MSTTATTPTRAKTGVREHAVDAVRHAAHFAHEARLVKSLATDAIDEATHASKQAFKTVRRQAQSLVDRRYDIEHKVRREPLRAIGITFGAGMILGVITGLVCGRRTRRG